jgi:hypothetical protein
MATPQPPDWGTREMSPKAREHYAKYLSWLEDRRREVDSTPLIVLVWGPGADGRDLNQTKLYQKRLQIRDILRERGHAAAFSEDIDAKCRDFSASSRARELLQAHGADFIIVIYGSPGSIAETHDFGGFLDELGSKMFVFIDSRYVSGYGYTGLLSDLKVRFNNVHTYEYPKDIDDCHLATAVEERLANLQWAKWWLNRLGSRGID